MNRPATSYNNSPAPLPGKPSENDTKNHSTLATVGLYTLSSIAVGLGIGAIIYGFLEINTIESVFVLPGDNELELNVFEEGSEENDTVQWDGKDWVVSQLPEGDSTNIPVDSLEAGSARYQIVQRTGVEWTKQIIQNVDATSLSTTGVSNGFIPQLNGTEWVYQKIQNIPYTALPTETTGAKYLFWDGSNWDASPITNITVNQLEKGTTDGQMYIYDSSGTWTIKKPAGTIPVTALVDGTNGNYVQFNGTNWIEGPITGLPITVFTPASSKSVIYWNGGSWNTGTPNGLLPISVLSNSSVYDGALFSYNGSNWEDSYIGDGVSEAQFNTYTLGEAGLPIITTLVSYESANNDASRTTLRIQTDNGPANTIVHFVVDFKCKLEGMSAACDNGNNPVGLKFEYTRNGGAFTAISWGGSNTGTPIDNNSLVYRDIDDTIIFEEGDVIDMFSTITSNRTGTPEVFMILYCSQL